MLPKEEECVHFRILRCVNIMLVVNDAARPGPVTTAFLATCTERALSMAISIVHALSYAGRFVNISSVSQP